MQLEIEAKARGKERMFVTPGQSWISPTVNTTGSRYKFTYFSFSSLHFDVELFFFVCADLNSKCFALRFYFLNYSLFLCYRVHWFKLSGEYKRLSRPFMPEWSYVRGWRQFVHLPMSRLFHGSLLQPGRWRMRPTTECVQKRRNMYQHSRWIFVHLRQRLDGLWLFRKYRRLRRSRLLQRCNLSRSSWKLLLSMCSR